MSYTSYLRNIIIIISTFSKRTDRVISLISQGSRHSINAKDILNVIYEYLIVKEGISSLF